MILSNIYLMFQDSQDHLFNFIPTGEDVCGIYKNRTNEHRSRPVLNDAVPTTSYEFIKKPAQGHKLIRIEIYNANSFDTVEDTLCKCKAELCVQHVVKTILFDDIYISICDIVTKIQELFEK